MGITGLIPLLEKSWRPVKVSEFSGCTVAIDAYCWLHKGVYACAEKLARGENCQEYVYYCMRFVSMLLAQNIKPILVFDGQRLPAKADTESKRHQIREQNRKKAAELMRLDKTREASSLLRRSIDVTHKMALNLIKRCREINVDCIVAPYEADSQLAYLNLSGIAHIVITEDSDLLLFGCKKVLFKLDQYGGGVLIEQEKIHLSMNMQPEQFSFDKFRYMCILSGCDYLPSIPGVGLAKARQFISRTSEPDIYKSLMRLGSFINGKIPPDYRDKFMDADRMFLYQPVYDPLSRQIIPLNKISDPSFTVLVSNLTSDRAYQLALGNIDPISLEVMDDWDPDIQMTSNNKQKNKVIPAQHISIWSKNYQPTEFKPNIENVDSSNDSKLKPYLTQKVVKSSPTSRRKASKNVTQSSQSSPTSESPSIKKRLPVTEDDILTTLDEIDENEKVSEEHDTDVKEKYQSKKSISNRDIFKKVIIPEIDSVTAENEDFSNSKQLTKRKYTIIDSEKQVVSGYFSNQKPMSFEEKCINPFKIRKTNTSKAENVKDNLNTSLNSSDTFDEINKSESFESKNISDIDTNILHKSTPSMSQTAFCWKSYSNNTPVKNDNEKQYQKVIPHNSQQIDNILINDDDTTKVKILALHQTHDMSPSVSSIFYMPVDSENDIDEGFCSQSTKESIISKATPKQKKRSCPRTGLSKSTGKSSQSLLSKFGFKTGEQLKR